MVGENGTPETPDWSPDPREAPTFTKPEVKQPCQLCKQRLDGRGDQ